MCIRDRHRHDTRGKWVKYEIGQLVLVRRHDLSSAQEKEIKKFFLLYEGPYKIVGIKMENAYVLQDMDTGKVVAVSYTHLDVYKRQGA